MNRRLLTYAAICAVLPFVAGCLGENRAPPKRARAIVQGETFMSFTRPDIDEERIKQFGFTVYWDSFIRDEVITSVTMEGNQLYAFTDSKRLYQIDVQSGMVNWVYDVGRKLDFTEGGRAISEWVYNYKITEVGAKPKYKDYDEIFFCAQDHLYALDKNNGSLLWSVYLPFTPSSPPQASATHVYVGSWDDRIYAIRKDTPLIPAWSWRTEGDVLARPAFAKPTVFVSSTDGTLHTFDGAKGTTKWPFPTEKRLIKDPLVFRSLLYLPAEDFNLYVLGTSNGLVHYRFCPGAPISTHPVAIDKTIYFGAEEKGFYALLRTRRPKAGEGNTRKIGHELLWNRKGADKLLCKGVDDIYLREPSTEANGFHAITRIDAKDGHFRDALELGGIDYWVTNSFSPASLSKDESIRAGIIFLGFQNGWIVALKETATIPGA